MAEPSAQYNVPLQQLLKTMVEYGGTDLHITTDSAPQIVAGVCRKRTLARASSGYGNPTRSSKAIRLAL